MLCILIRVKLAIDLKNQNKLVAIKIWKENEDIKNRLSLFMNEIRILSMCDNPHIIKIQNANISGIINKRQNIKRENKLYYSMSYTRNYELFNLIKYTGNFSENISRYLFIQLLSGKNEQE